MQFHMPDSVINSVCSLWKRQIHTPVILLMPSLNRKLSGIPFLAVDDKKEASVASMIYNGANCWGEEGASPSVLMRWVLEQIDGY